MSEELREELIRLLFAWKEYTRDLLFYSTRTRKLLTSAIMGLGSSFLVGSIFWWLKSSVYAQPEAALSPASSFSLPAAFPWIMSGGVVSVVVGFARTNYQVFKRCFDLLVASISLVILSPLFLIIGILIKIDSEGQVFLKQDRVGKDGEIFKMWKFRTMRNNAELETGPVWAQNDDPRVTRIGEFLRRSHLDELPQLINALRGQMSLIGPRPERPEFMEMIVKRIPQFPHRLNIKPGITGLAQVRYRYGASIKDAGKKLRYDLLYIKRVCWLLDVRILFWTVGRVLTGEGTQ
ncbi:MAG: sugar transferase [Candidatus Omnitrophota bacterium]|nr:MAG: sugar transferase [Candidatus Omnitrophota bacterium]